MKIILPIVVLFLLIHPAHSLPLSVDYKNITVETGDSGLVVFTVTNNGNSIDKLFFGVVTELQASISINNISLKKNETKAFPIIISVNNSFTSGKKEVKWHFSSKNDSISGTVYVTIGKPPENFTGIINGHKKSLENISSYNLTESEKLLAEQAKDAISQSELFYSEAMFDTALQKAAEAGALIKQLELAKTKEIPVQIPVSLIMLIAIPVAGIIAFIIYRHTKINIRQIHILHRPGFLKSIKMPHLPSREKTTPQAKTNDIRTRIDECEKIVKAVNSQELNIELQLVKEKYGQGMMILCAEYLSRLEAKLKSG
ncbi:MAG TPA: hypothetical protein VI968_00565 [archaeon]|nr:hypothetical protein [archaeon]